MNRAGARGRQAQAAVLGDLALEPQRVPDHVDLGDLGRVQERLEHVHDHGLAGDLDERLAAAADRAAGAAVAGHEDRLNAHGSW